MLELVFEYSNLTSGCYFRQFAVVESKMDLLGRRSLSETTVLKCLCTRLPTVRGIGNWANCWKKNWEILVIIGCR